MSDHRPPPYFPQTQLSPPDPNRFKKFKGVVALLILGALLLLTGAGLAVFYLIKWLAA